LLLILGTAPVLGQEKMAESTWYPLQVGNKWVYRVGDEKITIRVARHEVLSLKGNAKEQAARLEEQRPEGAQDAAVEAGDIGDQVMQQMQDRAPTIGFIGLGVMGTSLARNIAGKGFSISIYNRHVAGKEEGIAKKMTETFAELYSSKPFDDIQMFVASLSSPRKIFLMVNAGRAVDDVIQHLLPFLTAGDTIVDGGNSYYKDTDRRQKQLDDHGIHFVGAGVSGGEEGALLGPSIMPGARKRASNSPTKIMSKRFVTKELFIGSVSSERRKKA